MRIFVLTLLACSTLLADDASKTAKIEQFLVIIKANAVQDQIYREVGQQIDNVTQTIAQRANVPAPERASATAEIKDKMMASMKQYMSWDQLKPGLIKAYADAYSEPELDQLIAFFKSPIGQVYIAKSPQIADQTRIVAETQIKAMQSVIQPMIKEWLDKHQPPASAPPANSPPSLEPVH